MIQKEFSATTNPRQSFALLAKAKYALYGPQDALTLLERKKFQYNEHPKILIQTHTLSGAWNCLKKQVK